MPKVVISFSPKAQINCLFTWWITRNARNFFMIERFSLLRFKMVPRKCNHAKDGY